MRPLTISISNNKGGVAKTTTAVTLADLFAAERERVLVVDLDPQGNATQHLLGHASADAGQGVLDVLRGRRSLAEIAVSACNTPVHIAPSGLEVASAEGLTRMDLAGGQLLLKQALEAVAGTWDVVIIDCPPSNPHLVNCALAAAHAVLVPCELEPAAIKGLAALTHSVQQMRDAMNPELNLAGIFATKVKSRRGLTNEVWDVLRGTYGPVLFESYVRDDAAVAGADGYAEPVTRYKARTPGSKDYRDVYRELRARLARIATAAA